MRLIDIDDLVEAHYAACENDHSKSFETWSLELMKNAPTIDAVPAVRCEDCIYDGLSTCPMCYIENHTLCFVNHDANFFCAKGETK